MKGIMKTKIRGEMSLVVNEKTCGLAYRTLGFKLNLDRGLGTSSDH